MHKADGTVPAIDTRFFNPATNEWTIYWASAKDYEWQSNPMRGGFSQDDALVLIIEDTSDDHRVLTRYAWRVLSHDHALWE